MKNSNTPCVGVGVDYKQLHTHDYPGGLHGLFSDYRMRLSHVQIVTFPDDELAMTQLEHHLGHLPLVHHLTSIDPVEAGGPNLELFEKQDSQSRRAGALWQYEDLGYWHVGPYNAPYFAPPILDEETADHTAKAIRELNRRASVPFLAENPTCSFVAGPLSLGQFFTRVAEQAGCALVLDVSHLLSYALWTEQAPRECIEQFPLERIWELHVAGGRLNTQHQFHYLDSHCDPVMDAVYELVEFTISRCSNLKAITYELGTKLPERTFRSDFERLTEVVSKTGFRPDLTPQSTCVARGGPHE